MSEFDIKDPLGMSADVSNEDYHAAPGISNTGLSRLSKSFKHYEAYRNQEFKETDALIFGRQVHEAVLEPEKFQLAIAPDIPRRSKADKETHAQFELDNIGKTIMKKDKAEALKAMKKNIFEHDAARKALEGKGRAEVSYWGYDPLSKTGELCKVRVDWDRDDDLIVDLKTTTDASKDAVTKAMWDYRYFVQAAFYSDIRAAVTGRQTKGFLFVFVEKEPPYGVAVYAASDELIEYGRMEYERLLRYYSECRVNQTWPGYDEGVQTVNLPYWAKKKVEGANE